MELEKDFTFEASHVLPNHPGKCSNLHGHSWTLSVSIRGPLDRNTGMVADFADLKAAVQPIVDELDHAHLGAWLTPRVEIRGGSVDEFSCTKRVNWLPGDPFNPTCENLLVEIAKQLVKRGCPFSYLTLKETASTWAGLSWEEFQRIQGNHYIPSKELQRL